MPKPPRTGWREAISPIASAIVAAIMAPSAKEMITAGPAMPIASPEPRNRPVPSAEPMAIIAIWPWPSERASCPSARSSEEEVWVVTRRG